MLIQLFFRTIESLFEELVEQELLKKADDVKLKDYLGKLVYGGKKANISNSSLTLSEV